VTADRRKHTAVEEGFGPGWKPKKRPELEASYRKLFRDLVRRARWKYGLSREDASDVVQEAFLVALVKIGSVRNTRAWLEGVVDRLAVNFIRTGERRARLLSLWKPSDQRPDDEVEETNEL
jgi:DNA-directed RNA polymerase specialized sigma24 family protein